jgi:hypothetical protein
VVVEVALEKRLDSQPTTTGAIIATYMPTES